MVYTVNIHPFSKLLLFQEKKNNSTKLSTNKSIIALFLSLYFFFLCNHTHTVQELILHIQGLFPAFSL